MKALAYLFSLFVISLVLVDPAFATTGTTMPWESPLTTLEQSVTGPVARAIGIIAIVVTGLGIAFGEGGTGLRKILWIVFGLSVAFSATGVFRTLVGGTTGAVF